MALDLQVEHQEVLLLAGKQFDPQCVCTFRLFSVILTGSCHQGFLFADRDRLDS